MLPIPDQDRPERPSRLRGAGGSPATALASRCLGAALSLLALTVLFVSAEGATIYRWVSPRGVVSYGETPPPGAKDVQVISGAPEASVSVPQPAVPAEAPPSHARSEPQAPQATEGGAHAQALKRMEAELAAARLQLAQAVQAYEEGKAVRYGNERNYVRYQERVAGLKNQVDAAKLRVVLIERQIQQLSASRGPAAQ